jgi:hypothetical protein
MKTKRITLNIFLNKEANTLACYMMHTAVWFILLAGVLSLSACKTNEQKTQLNYTSFVELNSDILVGPGQCILKKFQGTSVNNIFYINWIFISNTKNFIFQLEKSTDGKHYTSYWMKEGVCSPTNAAPLLLCVKDSTTTNETVFFRLKAIPASYNLELENSKQYSAMVNASTIMLKRNKKTKEFSLLAD